MSFAIALVGAVFGVVAVVSTLRGTRAGKVMAVIALVLNIVACAAVLAAQDSLSKAVDEAFEGPTVTATTAAQTTDGSQDASSSDEAAAQTELAVGQTAQLSNGLSVTVNSVQPGLVNYDGDAVTGVSVTYANGGTGEESFNEYDWKAQDERGVLSNITYYSDAQDELSAGSLIAGGSVTGMLYFDGTITKVAYYSSVFSSSAAVTWNVSEE
jgi:hypothetical protein